MNKLEKFVYRLAQAGLSDRQVDEAVFALNEYNNARFDENVQQGNLISKLYANGYNDAATFLVDDQDPRSLTDILTAQQGRNGGK